MKKQQKVEIVKALGESLGDAQAAVVVEYKGMTVESLYGLRKQLRDNGSSIRVVKSTLMIRSVDGTPNEPLKDLAGGPIAVAYTAGDAAGLAKDLTTYAKKERLLVIRGGILGGKLLEAADVLELATLPSLPEMRAKVLGLFQAPAQQFLGLLQAAPRDFLGVLQAKAEQEQEAAG